MYKSVLVTGAAGFVASSVCQLLLDQGIRVVGLDNMNDYYDRRVKIYRLERLKARPGFEYVKGDIEDRSRVDRLFAAYRFSAVINLAARAGVRSSLENPYVYMTTNGNGTLHLLEAARRSGVTKFILASTSSLYAGQRMPFKESLPVNTPISPYAASKKAAEAMCYAYHHLYQMHVTILRYFTVYGPAGRPDMSIFRFIKWTAENQPLEVFGDGNQKRDFTHVSDIADGTVRALKLKGYQIVNLGGNRPEKLKYAIRLIEKELGKKARLRFLPGHRTDMDATWADTTEARQLLGWKAKITLEAGIRDAVRWYLENRSWLIKIRIP